MPALKSYVGPGAWALGPMSEPYVLPRARGGALGPMPDPGRGLWFYVGPGQLYPGPSTSENQITVRFVAFSKRMRKPHEALCESCC